MGKITLYTRDGCPDSHAAKLDLQLLHLPYLELELQGDDGAMSSPLLYFDDILIDGGLNALVDKLLVEDLSVEAHDDARPSLTNTDESGRLSNSMMDDTSYREDWERYARREHHRKNNMGVNTNINLQGLKEEVQDQLEILKGEIYEEFQREMRSLKGTIAGLKGTVATLKASLNQSKQIQASAAEDQQEIIDALQRDVRALQSRMVECEITSRRNSSTSLASTALEESRFSNHSKDTPRKLELPSLASQLKLAQSGVGGRLSTANVPIASTNSRDRSRSRTPQDKHDSYTQRSRGSDQSINSSRNSNHEHDRAQVTNPNSENNRPSQNRREMFQKKPSNDRHSFQALREGRKPEQAAPRSPRPCSPIVTRPPSRREMFQKKTSYDRHSYGGNELRQRLLQNSTEQSSSYSEGVNYAEGDDEDDAQKTGDNGKALRETRRPEQAASRSPRPPSRREMFQKKTSYDRNSYAGNELRQRILQNSTEQSSSYSEGLYFAEDDDEDDTQKSFGADRGKALQESRKPEQAAPRSTSRSHSPRPPSRREMFQKKTSYDRNSYAGNELRQRILQNSTQQISNHSPRANFAQGDNEDDDQNSFCGDHSDGDDDKDNTNSRNRLSSLPAIPAPTVFPTGNPPVLLKAASKSSRSLQMQSTKSMPSMRGKFSIQENEEYSTIKEQMGESDFVRANQGKRSMLMKSAASVSVRSFNSNLSGTSTMWSTSYADNMVELPLGNIVSVLEATVELKRILPIEDMKYNRTTYKNSFKGTSVADTFMDVYSYTRKEAVDLGKSLHKAKMLHHVCNDHSYKDVGWYFRLHCHQTPEVLNSFCAWTDEATLSKHCKEVIEEIMAKLQGIMDTITCKDSGKVDYARASMVDEEVMLELDFAVCELQMVKLARLDQRDLLAVGLNVFQIFLHYAFMKFGVPSSSNSPQSVFWTKLKLDVGGDLFSLHEWFNGICRGNKKGQHGLKPFQGKDPRCFLKLPDSVDNRVHFAAGMTHFIKPMFVYKGGNTNKQLDHIAKLYFKRAEFVTLDESASSLSLSPNFHAYLDDFASTTKALPMAILKWLPRTEQSHLEKMVASKKKIKVDFKGDFDSWDDYVGQHVQFKSAPKADFKTLISLSSAGVDLGMKTALARVTRRLGDGVAQPVTQVKNNIEAALESPEENTSPCLSNLVPL